jgi:hypothetical protein
MRIAVNDVEVKRTAHLFGVGRQAAHGGRLGYDENAARLRLV